MNAVLTTTASKIVEGALRLIGEVDANQPVGATEMQDGLESLNQLIKGWQSQGLHLWTKTEGVLFLDVGRQSYKIGPGGDECGNADDLVTTELSVAAAASDRTIVVDSTTGIDGADDILPYDPGTTTQGWTAVAGTIAVSAGALVVANASGSAGEAERSITGLVVGRQYRVIASFTLGTSPSVTYAVKDGATTLATDTLTATGSSKFDFTATQTSHTFEILNGDTAGTNDTNTSSIQILDATTGDLVGVRLDDNTRQWSKAVEVVSSTDIYLADAITGAAAVDNSVFSVPELLPRPVRVLQLRRDTIGTSDEIEADQWSREDYFAQPDKDSQGDIVAWYYSPQLTNGQLYIWQTANDVDKVARFTYERPIDITPTTADSPDIPSEWFRTLRYNLAVDIAPEYRIPMDRYMALRAIAEELKSESLGFDFETAPMDMQPDY